MRRSTTAISAILALCTSGTAYAKPDRGANVQLGPRPYYLVEQLADGPLKSRLEQCASGPFRQTPFSIGHRGGGTLQFPEHTKESHEAGARMGAGILECDVTFTSDGRLVCRHDQCDLHTTTDILVTPLASKCSVPFSPAEFDATGNRTKAASALCCASDLTLAEFKTLRGKMDASDPGAHTPQQFLGGTPRFRTDLYATGGTLLTHAESIELIRSLGAKFTPELKGPNRRAKLQVEDVFGSQAAYAQAMIDEYKAAHVPPSQVFAQSFNRADILYWIGNDPRFGRQAVYLDDRYETATPRLDPNDPATWIPSMRELREQGIRIIAPPMWVLLNSEDGKIVPSEYAKAARSAGLEVITWTLERSGRIEQDVIPSRDFYYQSVLPALRNDGDILVALDVLDEGRRHSRHLLGLVGHGHVLRKLHGAVTAGADGHLSPAHCPSALRRAWRSPPSSREARPPRVCRTPRRHDPAAPGPVPDENPREPVA